MSNGTARTTLTQKRRVMSWSSGLSSSPPAAPARGSRAIPQMGQLPGTSRTTSGCIGQTHSVRVAGGCGLVGSRPIPHFGQVPGSSWRTSGCMGHV